MAAVDVSKTCLDSIGRVAEHIKDAVLYLDSGCTECFQYIGAFPLLLDLGLRAVCSLEDLSPLDMVVNWNSKVEVGRDVAVITSHLLSDAHRYILRCLSSHKGVRRCTIFTCISEIAHSAYPDSPLGSDAFHEYEALLVQDFEELSKKRETKVNQTKDSTSAEASEFEGWPELTAIEDNSPTKREWYEDNSTGHPDAGGLKLVVSVHHFPCVLCPLSPRAFVLPSEGSIAEAYLSTENEYSLSQGLPPLSTGNSFDGDDSPPGAILTAHFLYHLAALMDLKLEIFSLGDLSKSIGKMLTDMSSLYDVGRRKKSAGLLVIDRTLDLLTPCCHGDSLMDRVFSSLPRRERFVTSMNMKSPRTQPKQGIGNLQRASLDVQIPLSEILSREDGKADNVHLLKGTNSFLRGWNSGCFSSQAVNSVNVGSIIRSVEMPGLASELCFGSLVSTECFRGTPYVEALLDRRTKDGAVLVKKWLQEALRRENITTNIKIRPGFPGKSDLLPLIRVLARSQSTLVQNKGLIQIAAATLASLEESCSSRWDAYSSAEKMLNVSAGDTSQSLAAQIGDLISNSALLGSLAQKNVQPDKSQRLLSFQDALLLTVVGYLLAGENFPTSGSSGPFSWQEEHLLKEAMVDAILENPSIAELKFLNGLKEELETNKQSTSKAVKEEATKETLSDGFDDDQWGSWGDEDAGNKDQDYSDMQLKLELHDRVDNLFKFLHKLSSFKCKGYPLSEGASPFESNIIGDPGSNKCLLYRLVTRILNKSDLHGLEYHSSTVGRFFKSGFGRLGLVQAKPQLSDQSVILVFVVGGISAREIREIQEAVSESGRPDVELILGGTTLLTPQDMLELLLGQYSYS